MMRPAHAVDCPACDGWIGGAELLCVQCTNRVQAIRPDAYPTWLGLRAQGPSEKEALARGMITGMALALHAVRRFQKGARS